MEELYRVWIKDGTFELDARGPSAEFVERTVETYYLRGRSDVGREQPSTNAANAGALVGDLRPTSLRELRRRIGPEKKTEVAAMIAYYLENQPEVAVQEWKPSEVAARFSELREEAPSNPAMTIGSSDFFMRSGTAGHYKLSSTGVRWIELRLSETSEG